MKFDHVALWAIAVGFIATPALAEEWIAERLRGQVHKLEHGDWTALERGEVVPDGRKIRTGGDGRVDLLRGQESIALGPNTQVEVRDAAGQKMTSVIQSGGVVTVTAERRNVQHFSVLTPVLAAVVKGTQFTVTHRNGQTRVDVDEGVVQVQHNGHDMVADVSPGQSAQAGPDAPLDVSGPGSDRVVYLIEGSAVPAPAREAVLQGELPPEAALGAVRSNAVPQVNVSAGAGGQGVDSRAESGSYANGNSGNSSGFGNRQNADDSGGNGPPAHSNAGGNRNGSPPTSGGSGQNSASGSGAGLNGNGPPTQSHPDAAGSGPPAHSNAASNGNSSGHQPGPPEHSNAGGNGPGNAKGRGDENFSDAGNESGPPDHSNAGGNGKGQGKKD